MDDNPHCLVDGAAVSEFSRQLDLSLCVIRITQSVSERRVHQQDSGKLQHNQFFVIAFLPLLTLVVLAFAVPVALMAAAVFCLAIRLIVTGGQKCTLEE